MKVSADEKNALLRELKLAKAKDNEVKKLNMELGTLKLRLKKTEQSKEDADNNITTLQEKVNQLKSQISDSEKSSKAFATEKDNLKDQIANLKRSLQNSVHEKEELEILKAKTAKELETLNRKVANGLFEQERLQKELNQKNSQMEKLRKSITDEVQVRATKLSEEKNVLEESERKLKSELKDLTIKHDTLNMQKNKMVREIEDLNHDISREQKSAMAAERLKDQLQEKLNALRDASEKEKRNRSESEVAKRKLTASLELTKAELEKRTEQLMALQRVIDPRSKEPMDWSKASQETQKLVDLGTKLQESEQRRKKAEEAKALLQVQLQHAKARWSKELDEKDSKYYASKRALLEELSNISSPPNSPGKRPLSLSSFSTFNEILSPRKSNLSERILIEDKENIDSFTSIQGKSTEEIENLISTLQTSKNDLLSVYHETSKNLVKAKETLAEVTQEKNQIERELHMIQNGSPKLGNESEMNEIKIHLEAEILRSKDLVNSMKLYKNRAEEYFNRLESAETVVLKATRSEAFAKQHYKDAEDALGKAQTEYRESEANLVKLQSKHHELEASLEDKSIDLAHYKESNLRMSKELEFLRNRQSKESSDISLSLDAMRGRYSEEIRSLSSELESEKHRSSQLKRQMFLLERDLDAANSSSVRGSFNFEEESWSKIKHELESKIDDLSKSNEEATLAYQDSQRRIGSLLSQVRTLRTTMDEITMNRDQLQKDKRTLEQRLSEVSQRFEELAVPGGTPRQTSSVSNSNNDREVQDLRLALKKQTDASADVLERLRHTKNQFEQDRKAIEQERALNEELRVAQSQHEKEKQALSLKIIDLEARLLGPSGPDSKYLQDKVAALERQIEEQSRRYVEETRQVRTNDRSVKDLYSQLSQKDKLIARLQDDASRLESKMQRLLESMEALQTSETNHRLSARRAKREARDVKERSLRHEKELEEWKNRFESLTSRGESFV